MALGAFTAKIVVADCNSPRYSSGYGTVPDHAWTDQNSSPSVGYRAVERLKNILLESTKKTFWVRAQLVSGSSKGGHFYGELVDIGDRGETIAKMRVMIWRAEYEKIRQKLIDDGQPDTLQGNPFGLRRF
jgi:OB-fold nucleic acid binding domain